MTEETTPQPIETVDFDTDYIDHPFIPSRAPQDVKEFFAAFAKAQTGYKPVMREREVTIKPREGAAYKFKYAELANVIEATKSLAENGIAVSQPVHQDKAGKLWLYTIVAHASGAGLVTRMSLYGDADLKKFGGEISYCRRYCFAPAIGVASEDDADSADDGRGGGDGQRGDDRAWERDEPSRLAAKPTPQRKAPAEPAAGKDAAAATKPTAGALKNVLGKLAALGLAKEDETAMLAVLEVPENPDNWTLADWQKVKAEVERRMAA